MKTTFGTWLSALAICALVTPAQAAEPSTDVSTVTDIAFAATGSLVGTVVDEAGKPLKNVPVRIVHKQKIVATAKTNAKGNYSVKGLRSGLHVVQTPSKSQACRFWTATTAPPSARKSLVMANSQTILRGQSGGIGVGTMLAVGSFAAVTAVTVSSSTGNEKSEAAVVAPPASP